MFIEMRQRVDLIILTKFVREHGKNPIKYAIKYFICLPIIYIIYIIIITYLFIRQ